MIQHLQSFFKALSTRKDAVALQLELDGLQERYKDLADSYDRLLHRMEYKIFDWEFTTKGRSPEETIAVFTAAYNLPGWKELLANDVYFYKRKFIESRDKEESSLFIAEAYQRLLEKMSKSHELFLAKQKKEVEDKAIGDDAKIVHRNPSYASGYGDQRIAG